MLESEDPAQHSRDFELASVHDRRVRLLKQCAEGSSAAAQAQIEHLRLLAAQTYLAFELAPGARPIAGRTLTTRVGKGVQSPQHALLFNPR